jgi:hypothetical protein
MALLRFLIIDVSVVVVLLVLIQAVKAVYMHDASVKVELEAVRLKHDLLLQRELSRGGEMI